MGARQAADEEIEEPSRAAGACVLVVLGGLVDAVAWAVDEAAGVLLLVAVGWFALWRSVRHTANPAPPPGVERPSCRECAGHELLSVTPLAGAQKGMLIYTSASPDAPNRSHIHIAGEVNSE